MKSSKAANFLRRSVAKVCVCFWKRFCLSVSFYFSAFSMQNCLFLYIRANALSQATTARESVLPKEIRNVNILLDVCNSGDRYYVGNCFWLLLGSDNRRLTIIESASRIVILCLLMSDNCLQIHALLLLQIKIPRCCSSAWCSALLRRGWIRPPWFSHSEVLIEESHWEDNCRERDNVWVRAISTL